MKKLSTKSTYNLVTVIFFIMAVAVGFAVISFANLGSELVVETNTIVRGAGLGYWAFACIIEIGIICVLMLYAQKMDHARIKQLEEKVEGLKIEEIEEIEESE